MSDSAIVLINGFGTSGSELKYLYKRINSSFTCDIINFDYVPGGYQDGKFPRVNKNTFHKFIDDLLVRTEQYESVYVIGYSVGAVTAMNYATLAKNVVKLVLISPLLEYKNLRNFILGFTKSRVKSTEISRIERTFYNIALKRALMIPKLNFWHVDRYLNGSRKVYRHVSCDVLIVNTTNDEVVHQKTIDYLYNTIQSTKKRIFDVNASHLLFFNRVQREIAVDEIINYLNEE